jgi:hypothetical protein
MWCSFQLRHEHGARGLNAKVGKESYLYPVRGGHSLHNETNNGKWMVNIAMARDFSVTRTWYQHKDIHRVTWRSPDNKICNQTNHILVDRRLCTNVWDGRNTRSAEIESHHYLVRVKIRLKTKKVRRLGNVTSRNGILLN